jgi:hypothetical protein
MTGRWRRRAEQPAEPIIVGGDATDISVWDDRAERTGTPASLQTDKWPAWRAALLARPELHDHLGGTAIVRDLRLMFVPPMSWPDRVNRSASIGFPITRDGGQPVNVVRRYLDDKTPKYKGLAGCGHHVWPDIGGWRKVRSWHPPLLLVCGMRDVCFARAAGLSAYTNTGGVEGWLASGIESATYRRRFVVCLDRGEER